MLHDIAKKLIHFQAFPDSLFAVEDSQTKHVTISESDFEPAQPAPF